VCPTSRTIRNFERSHIVATGFNEKGATGPRAASLTVRGFGETICFAKVTCFGDLPCFAEPLTTSDSRPASLTSIGRSTNAANAAMMVGRRRQMAASDRVNFLSDDSNPCLPQE
jgi:hypothetical protein